MKILSTQIEPSTKIITGAWMDISGTENELDIRFKLLVEPRGGPSATPAEPDEPDAKLGRRYM